jgi:hypothetical protein
MARARLGSLLGGLCSALVAVSLILVKDDDPHWILWCVCGALFISSVGVWCRKRWAQVTFLVFASSLLLLYAAEIEMAPGACAGTIAGCYNYYIQHAPLLTVSHYFASLTCSHPLDLCCSEHLVQCHKLSMYVQPALTLSVTVILLKPLATNPRLERP